MPGKIAGNHLPNVVSVLIYFSECRNVIQKVVIPKIYFFGDIKT
jgi:hypothetical protein